MKFVKLTTLAFDPTNVKYKNSPCLYIDEYITTYWVETYINIAQIESVSGSDHPEIEVYQDRDHFHTIPKCTTVVRMISGKTHHIADRSVESDVVARILLAASEK